MDISIDIRYDVGRIEYNLVLMAAYEAGLSWGGWFNDPDPIHFYVDPTGGDREKRAALVERVQKEYNSAKEFCKCK